MCPFCFASIGLIVAGATSAGGLAALAVRLSGNKASVLEIVSDSIERNSQHEKPHRR